MLRDLLKEVSVEHHLLMGDFNYPGVQWLEGGAVSTSTTEETRLFQECLEDNFITQHVDFPTRKDAILDLILSKEPDLVTSLSSIGRFADTDHQMLQWEISIRADVELASTTGRDYNKADYEGMRKELEEVDWPMLLGSRPMEDAWLRFKRIYNNLEDRYIPMKRSTTGGRKKPKWLSNKAINMVKKKHRVFRKYRRNDHPACVAASRDASSAVRKAKYAFEKKLADNIKSDNKSFYAYVRSKSKVKVKPGPLLSDTGRLIDSPQEMSEEFNRYFSSVFTAENVKNMPAAEQMFVGRDEEALLNVVISGGTILEKLKKLREDKAPGDDGIMSRVMHQLQDQLVEPLKLMFEQSMQ
jgi:hypothetical protein